MKKNYFTLILVFIATIVCSSQLAAQNVMSLSSAEGVPQDVVEIELSITNADSFVAFQTEIPLGDNLYYVENSAVLYRNVDHQLVASVVDGTLKLYSFSLSGKTFNDNDGVVVTFQLRLGNEPGNFPLNHTKAKIVSGTGNAFQLTTQNSSVTVVAPKLEISTPQLNYGHIPIRSSYNKTLTVRNSGNTSLMINGLQFSDESLSCPSFVEKTVAAGSSTSFTIVYSPTVAGAVNYNITVLSNAANGNQKANVIADPYSVNELHIVSTSGICDSVVEVSVKMNNMDAITGLQFCIKMPTALQYQANSFELTSRKADHLAAASMRNNTLVMVAYSPSNAAFSGEDGIIATFKLKIKGNSGYHYLYPDKVILTNAEAKNVMSDSYSGYVSVESPEIYVSSTLDMASSSVTEVIQKNFSITNNGKAPLRIDSVKFNDIQIYCSSELPLVINSYGNQDITICCARENEGEFQSMMRIYSNDPTNGLRLVQVTGNRYEPNGLVLDNDEIKELKYLDVSVNMNNYSEITALQADFSFPNKYYTLQSSDITLSERCQGFSLTSVPINDSTFKIIMFSMSNAIISGNEGEILKIRLTRKADADNGTATVSMKNIILSDVKGKNKNTEGNKTLFVDFKRNVSVAVVPEDGGDVAGTGSYNHGEEVTLTATPNEGYTFVAWKENGNVVSEELEYSFVITEPKNFIAEFALNSYDVNVSVVPENGGDVAGAGNYLHGYEVTLMATPNEGYTFVAWKENGNIVSEELEYNFVITEPKSIIAEFVLNSYDVNVSVVPEDGGDVAGAGNYLHGDEVTLTATPNEGYTFVAWKENGNVVSEELEYSFVITEPKNFIAEFALNSYDVNVSVVPENGGDVAGAGNYLHGDEVTLTATPNEGYTFVAWKENGNVVSEELEYSFVITEPKSFIAEFVLNSYDVNVSVVPENGGDVAGAGNYLHGDEVTLTATPNEGYTFVAWKENGNIVSEELEYSFVITEPKNFIAEFALNSYDVNVAVVPEDGGDVAGAGTYTHGEEVTLTATPNEGYTFVAWKENGNVVSEELEYNFVITEPKSIIAEFALNSYDVNVAVVPENGGDVAGVGNYLHGDEVTLTATPNEGYTFVAWKENGNVVSEELEYSFVITESKSFIAEFILNSYDVNVSVVPEDGGDVAGSGNYLHGDEVTLMATPNEGYTFVAWKENGNIVSEELEYSFVITEPKSFIAEFVLNSYDVNVSVVPEDGGDVAGAGTYTHSEEVTLTATPNEGYTFVAWKENGNVVSEELEYSFVITEPKNFIAEFVLNSYDVNVSVVPENGGDVAGSGNYLHGDEVTLTATPNEGYTFVAWKENGNIVSEELEYSFVITEPKSFIAEFALNSYDVNVAVVPEDGGDVAGAGTYTHGEEVTLTATPNEGYTFVAWKENGNVVSEELEYSFVITEPKSFIAEFALNSYDVNVSVVPENGGDVAGSGNYLHGDEVTLMATPNEGYTFVAWKENGNIVSEELEYSFVITEPKSIIAEFALNSYDVNVAVVPENGGDVAGSGNYLHGDEVTLMATPNEGYTFVAWKENGNIVSEELEYSFVITEPKNFIAEYALNSYDVNVSVVPEDGGDVAGTGSYNHGEEVTLTATPNEGYTFVAWKENGNVVSEELEYSFVITEPKSFIAEFVLNSYDINVSVVPEDGGDVAGAGTYTHGEEVTLTATPNEGYTFVAWKENGNIVSEELEYSFVITEPKSFIAEFILNSYDVNVAVVPEDGGDVAGTGSYNHGEEVTLTATPNEGYTFVNWTENGEVVSEESEYSFVITSDRNLVANFVSIESIETIFVSNFNIYPNPTNINEEIHLGMTFDKVEVYNSVGVKIIEYINTDKIYGIRIAGTYIIRVLDDRNVGSCRVIVK